MTIYAIADLHLSLSTNKPMDVFGEKWRDHHLKIKENWQKTITEKDIVLVAGDISWAMTFDQAKPDLDFLADLPGKKILIRGNHDYWWKKIKWMRQQIGNHFTLLQHDSIEVQPGVGIAGVRGWTIPGEPILSSSEWNLQEPSSTESDERIYNRERIRLQMAVDSLVHLINLRTRVVMMHFPPCFVSSTHQGFSDILIKGNVDICIFGHLHGKDGKRAPQGLINGVFYLFAAADANDFRPVPLPNQPF